MTIPFNRGLPDWTAGSASVTNGSRTVTFTGADLVSTDPATSALVQVCGRGDMFSIDGVDAVMIASVDAGGEEVTLIRPWTGATQVNVAYAITRMSIPASGSVAAAVQHMLTLGSDASPETSLTIDDGSGRLKLRINDTGIPELAVGPADTADATLKPSLSMSPSSGRVSFPNSLNLPDDIQASIASQGYVNKLRNGTMDVWQRGGSLTVTSTGAYAADGWFVLPTGGSVSVSVTSGRRRTIYSMRVQASAALTNLQVKQPIESLIAVQLSDCICTFQAQIFNATGSAIVPTLSIIAPSSTADNYASTASVISAVSLQSCADGVWSRVAYTFQAPASAARGLQVILDFGPIGSGSSIQMTEADLRETNSVAIGLNPNPPVPELRAVSTELTLCQRYYERFIGGGHWIPAGGGYLGQSVSFKTRKRITTPGVSYIGAIFSYGFEQPYGQFANELGVEIIAQTLSGGAGYMAVFEALAEIVP